VPFRVVDHVLNSCKTRKITVLFIFVYKWHGKTKCLAVIASVHRMLITSVFVCVFARECVCMLFNNAVVAKTVQCRWYVKKCVQICSEWWKFILGARGYFLINCIEKFHNAVCTVHVYQLVQHYARTYVLVQSNCTSTCFGGGHHRHQGGQYHKPKSGFG
jgi:hypothetical protein